MDRVVKVFGIRRLYPETGVWTCLRCDGELYRLDDLPGQIRFQAVRNPKPKAQKKGRK